MKKLAFIFLILFTVKLPAQVKELVGEKIPDSPVEVVLEAPVEAISSWKSLEGKWLLLDFWATWCAPCIAQFQALEKIEGDLVDENIQFISISPEKTDVVKRFLKRKRPTGWIAIDTDKSFVDAMGVTAYPTTVLVNPQGIVELVVVGKGISKDKILSKMNGEKEQKTKLAMSSATLSGQPNMTLSNGTTSTKQATAGKPIYEIFIEQDSANVGTSIMMSRRNGVVYATSIELSSLVPIAYGGISRFQVIGDENLLQERYNVRAVMPRGEPEILERTLQKALESRFKLNVEKKRQKLSVYTLTAPNGVNKELYESKADKQKSSSAEGNMAGYGKKIDSYFISAIENVVEAKVINETGLDGVYDYNLFWDAENPKSIIRALNEQLGLVLKSEEVELEVLEVRKKG